MKPCGKIKYTEDAAFIELRKAKRERKKWFGFTSRQEKRVYYCIKCKAYHLTSISENKMRLIKKKLKENLYSPIPKINHESK